MISDFVLALIVALLLCSNIFWAMVCLKLTNRIMSKNFGELVQATRKPVPVQPAPMDMFDVAEEDNANKANVLMGLV